MPEAPDLDTSTVRVVAFWNALDHGASSVDPAEIAMWGQTTSWEDYDNALDGTAMLQGNSPADVEVNFRIKTDGWILVWLDRSTKYIHLVDGWRNKGSPTEFPKTSLSRTLNELRKQLSTSSEMSFNHSDVGHYSYEHPGASTFSLIYGRPDMKVSYTEGTNRLLHIAGANIHRSYGDEWVEAKFNGQRIARSFLRDGESSTGSVDVLAKSAAPNPGTAYGHSLSGNNTEAYIKHLVIY